MRDILHCTPEQVQQAQRGMLSILFRSMSQALYAGTLGMLDEFMESYTACALVVLSGPYLDDPGYNGVRGPILVPLGRYAQALADLSATEPEIVH